MATTDNPQAYLDAVRSVLPSIRGRAREAEDLGRMPEATVRELDEIGVFRGLQPRRWDGLELDPKTFFESIMLIGSACGSAGWVAGVVGVHPWEVALLPDQAQREIWGENPRTRLSSSYAPTGQVRRVEGGFVLSGCWRFSSGVDLCDWAILGGVPEGEGEPETRAFVVSRADFTVDQESWQVAGLRGTGSKSVQVEDAFVPDYRCHRLADAARGLNPGCELNDGPLYRLPWLNGIFSSGIAAPAIGAATGALESYIEQNRTRVGAYGGPPVAENPAVHRRLANALAEVDGERIRMRATWDDFLAIATSGRRVPLEAELRHRYDTAHAMTKSLAAVLDVFAIAGGSAMLVTNPLQRFLRDLLAMRNHPMGALEQTATRYARVKLGLPANG